MTAPRCPVFQIDTQPGAETVLYSVPGGVGGNSPVAPLINAQGTLYGTTELGGVANNGVVFAVDTKTDQEKTALVLAATSAGGATPLGQLTDVEGLLHGTGSDLIQEFIPPKGTVFSLNPTSGAVTTLHIFADDANGNARSVA